MKELMLSVLNMSISGGIVIPRSCLQCSGMPAQVVTVENGEVKSASPELK